MQTSVIDVAWHLPICCPLTSAVRDQNQEGDLGDSWYSSDIVSKTSGHCGAIPTISPVSTPPLYYRVDEIVDGYAHVGAAFMQDVPFSLKLEYSRSVLTTVDSVCSRQARNIQIDGWHRWTDRQKAMCSVISCKKVPKINGLQHFYESCWDCDAMVNCTYLQVVLLLLLLWSSSLFISSYRRRCCRLHQAPEECPRYNQVQLDCRRFYREYSKQCFASPDN